MMTSMNIQLIVHYVMMVILIYMFDEAESQIPYSSYENKSQGHGKDVYYTTNFDQESLRKSLSSTELPISFKAPDLRSQNYWNNNQPVGPDRRTFFEDFVNYNYGRGGIFPNLNSFFEFMGPLFDRGKHFTPILPPPQRIKVGIEPYEYENKIPTSTERTFLPPPKPLRASIVKLEAVTRLPVWQSPLDYVTTPEPQTSSKRFSERPTTFYIDGLGFHSHHNTNLKEDPIQISVQKLTDEKNHASFMNPQRPSGDITTEPYDHQEQIAEVTLRRTINRANNNSAATRTTEGSVESITGLRESPGVIRGEEIGKNQSKYFGNNDEEMIKLLQIAQTNTLRKPDTTNFLKSNISGNNMVKAGVEETKAVKIVEPYRKSNAIKIVTDLTLEGLLKNTKGTVNVPRYTKFLNMSNLISYELDKLKQSKIPKPRSHTLEHNSTNHSYYRSNGYLNVNDDLSLDLKILRDTNWDGFAVQPNGTLIPAHLKEYHKSEIQRQLINHENLTAKSSNANHRLEGNSGENQEKHEKKTIVIETRVTKTISKHMPTINSKQRKSTNEKKRRDPRKEVDENSKMGTNATNAIISNKVEKNNAIYNEKHPSSGNTTEKNVPHVFQEIGKSSSDGSAFADRVPIRKYSSFLTNVTSNNFSTETISLLTQNENLGKIGSAAFEKKDSSRKGSDKVNAIKAVNTPNFKTLRDGLPIQSRQKKIKKSSRAKRRRTGKRKNYTINRGAPATGNEPPHS